MMAQDHKAPSRLVPPSSVKSEPLGEACMVRQLLGDVEEYVAKEEEHEAQEGWTEIIRWGTETVSK